MEFALTWNVVLWAGFVVLFGYNYILGQNSTLKLVLSMYISILSADAIAMLFKRYIYDISPGWRQLFGELEDEIFTITRLILFLLFIILFVVKGAFHIGIEKHDHWIGRLFIHGIFSAIGAILFISTILIYLSGSSFVEGMLYASEIAIYDESSFARAMIDHYQLWFSLPAIAFLVSSFFFDPELFE